MTLINSENLFGPDVPGALNPDAAADPSQRAIAWASYLAGRLSRREPLIRLCRQYRDGEQPLHFATRKWRETFGTEFGQIVDNWCRIIVDSATERMTVQGFRFNADDPQADKAAWEIWQRNRLDLDSDVAHTEAQTTGYSHLLIWPDDDTGEPVITVEDPLNTIVEFDPANRRKRLVGFKRWRQVDGRWKALLFTPTEVFELTGGQGAAGGWTVDGNSPKVNDLGIVPILEFANDPDIYGHGHSALAPAIPLNDAANKLLADMLVGSEFTAYRQRVLIGAEIPLDPLTGQPDQKIIGGINRWLAIEGSGEDGAPAPTIQELQAGDLTPYTGAIEMLVTHIAALTRTPPHYLLGQLVNVSADALVAAEAGLVSRVRRAMRFTGEVWEEAMRIAFLIKGDQDRATSWQAETIWADPETTSEAQRVDALVKLGSIGVPEQALWELDNRSPQTIERWVVMRDRQAQLESIRLGISGPSGLPTEAPPPTRSTTSTTISEAANANGAGASGN